MARKKNKLLKDLIRKTKPASVEESWGKNVGKGRLTAPMFDEKLVSAIGRGTSLGAKVHALLNISKRGSLAKKFIKKGGAPLAAVGLQAATSAHDIQKTKRAFDIESKSYEEDKSELNRPDVLKKKLSAMSPEKKRKAVRRLLKAGITE